MFKIFVIFIIPTIIGVFTVSFLSVRLNPNQELPSITVSYRWANTSPYILERDITSVLESGLSTIKGIRNLSSKSSKGRGYITLEFDKYTDIDIVRFEVAALIRQLHNQLPEQSSYPSITVNRPDEEETSAFLSYSINALDAPYNIQRAATTRITPILGAIKNIDRVEIYGANPKEYYLEYNTNLLKTLRINNRDIKMAIKKAFSNESLGETFYDNNYITLSIQEEKDTVNWHIPVRKINKRIIFLDELVTIKLEEQEATRYYRINGQNSITINLYATKQANTITLTKHVENTLLEVEKSLPKGYTITKTYDSTEYLQQELNKIYERSLYVVIILLLFILLISKSFSYLLIALLSLVANIAIAFLLYYAFGVEIQLYSLAGITISLGLIIDNSIVMIDHMRHQNNKSVFIPILASTLTTIGSLSVIYFLDEKYKVNLIGFALVIIINLSVSLLTSLFLIPALLKTIKIPIKKERSWSLHFKTKLYTLYSFIINGLLRYKKLCIILIILVFGIPTFMLPKVLENNDAWYEKAYNNTLGNEWYKTHIRPHLDRYLGGSFRLFSYYVFENASYQQNKETKLYVAASIEKGATVHQLNEVFLHLENYLKPYNEIKQFTTHVFSGDYARMEITFKEGIANSGFPFTVKSGIIEKAIDFGGVNWNIYGVGQGFDNGGRSSEPINFRVEAKGYNYNELNNWADSLKIALEKHPRVQKIIVRENSSWARPPSYKYVLNLDKERLALANSFPLKLIEQLKQVTLSKQPDMTLNIGGIYTPVRMGSKQADNFDVWDVKNSPLGSLSSPLVLNNMAAVSKEREEENIYKENQEYVRLVEFQYTGAAKYGSKFLNETLDGLKAKLPLGYKFEQVDHRLFFNQDQNNHYVFLLLLIICIIYLICAVLFESLKQPFIILSIVPISFIGVFLTFYLFDFNFDQGGMASFVLLSGITVNASIFIVNGFNKLKNDSLDKDALTLYLTAFNQKIFPIMLTILSTILGFIPFVKDGQNEVFWFALGVGTIGGLIFSLVGILFYLPIFLLKRK